MPTLADLARDRALRLKDLGPKPTMTLFNNGHALPGPKALRRICDALKMEPAAVMAVCRASMVARERSARLVGQRKTAARRGSRSVVRGSCAKPSNRRAAKVQG